MAFLIRLSVGNDLVYKAVTSEGVPVVFGNGPVGSISVDGWKKCSLSAEIQGRKLYVTGNRIPGLSRNPVPIGQQSVIISAKMGLRIGWVPYTGWDQAVLPLPTTGVVTIGRGEDNAVSMDSRLVSAHHAVICCENGIVTVEDGSKGRPSSNGSFLNGRRITKSGMRPGDVLDIVNFRIRLDNGTLQFENTSGVLRLNPDCIQIPARIHGSAADACFRRSPRHREALPQAPIVLDAVPESGGVARTRSVPPLPVFQAEGKGGNCPKGVSDALRSARKAGLVAPAVDLSSENGLRGGGKWGKGRSAAVQSAQNYLREQRALVQPVSQKQRRIVSSENPAPTSCLNVVSQREPSLWERRREDSDFLSVRIGMGYEPLCVPVRTKKEAMGLPAAADEEERLALRAAEELRTVDHVPARVDLLRFPTVGLVGKRANVASLLKNMLVALTTAHCWEDVRIVGVFDEQERKDWEPFSLLPHFRDEKNGNSLLFYDRKEPLRCTESFRAILNQLHLSHGGGVGKRAHCLLVFGSYDFAQSFGKMDTLLSTLSSGGASAVFAYNLVDMNSRAQQSCLPSQCRYLIDTDSPYGPSAWELPGFSGHIVFSLDAPLENEALERFCREMASIRLDNSARKRELPETVSFLEGYGVTRAEELRIWERWHFNRSGDGLKAPVALRSDGSMLEPVLCAENTPPITLAAGAPGTGKNQLLTSWILSLCVNYSPEELSIVLIDAKGSTVASSVKGLPHLVGIIEDCESEDLKRPIRALDLECSDRKKRLRDWEFSSWSAFRTAGAASGSEKKLPYLLVICTEFGLIQEKKGQALSTLLSLFTMGDSAGMGLVLATRHPERCVEQSVLEHSSCQICLRTASEKGSRNVLTTPDAALLTKRGRAFARIASDSIYEQVQILKSDAPCQPVPEEPSEADGWKKLDSVPEAVSDLSVEGGSETIESQAVIREINAVALEHGIRPAARLWAPELPERVSLHELPLDDDANCTVDASLRIPIGLFEEPGTCRQGVAFLDLNRDGHCGIFGTQGSGKRNLLKTILMGLGLFCSPEDVEVYIIGENDEELNLFDEMPHVVSCLSFKQSQELSKLAARLGGILNQRLEMLARRQEGLSSASPLCPVVVIIEQIRTLVRCCPNYGPLFTTLAEVGPDCGIHMVFTSERSDVVPSSTLDCVKSRISFEQQTEEWYATALKTPVLPMTLNLESLKQTRGRGLLLSGEDVLLFQAALYSVGGSDQELSENARGMIEEMQQFWMGI